MTGTLTLAREAWRVVPWRIVRITFLLGLGLFAFHVASRFGPRDFSIDAWPKWLGFMARTQLTAFAMMACVVVADHATGGQANRRGPYVLAVVVGAAGGALVTWSLQVGAHNAPRTLEGWLRVLYFQIEYMVLGGAVVFLWLDRRRAQAALARMHAAQLHRVEAGRRTLESQLQAMQARVEPQFLFDTLARVKRLYESAPDVGDRVLDALITYLRAAMPRMRDTSSTVGMEVDLVRAWLAIARVEATPALETVVDVPDDARRSRFPPMLLLPLVERLFAPHAGALHLGARIDTRRLQVTLEVDHAAPPGDDAALAGIRERLAALYGDHASLAISPSAQGGVQAVLAVPFDPVTDDSATAATDRNACAGLPSSGSTPAATAPTPAQSAWGSKAGTSRT